MNSLFAARRRPGREAPNGEAGSRSNPNRRASASRSRSPVRAGRLGLGMVLHRFFQLRAPARFERHPRHRPGPRAARHPTSFLARPGCRGGDASRASPRCFRGRASHSRDGIARGALPPVCIVDDPREARLGPEHAVGHGIHLVAKDAKDAEVLDLQAAAGGSRRQQAAATRTAPQPRRERRTTENAERVRRARKRRIERRNYGDGQRWQRWRSREPIYLLWRTTKAPSSCGEACAAKHCDHKSLRA